MSRGGRGSGYSPRGSSYRGGGNHRGGGWNSGHRGYSSPRGNGNRRFSSSNSSFSSNSYDRKYGGSSEKYGSGSNSRRNSGHGDDYKRPYKQEQSGGYRDHHRSPDRKRMRTESSHDRSFGGSGGDYKSRYENERRSFSNDRRSSSSYVRKEEFRKPPPPPSSPRGGYRGRGTSSRGGSLRARLRDRPVRKRLVESSYQVRRRVVTGRSTDFYNIRRLKINKLRSTINRRAKKQFNDKESDTEEVIEIKPVKVKEESANDTSDKEKHDDKEKEEPKKSSPKKVSPKKEKVEHVSDKEDIKEESEAETKVASVRLTCPHCLIRIPSFAKYTMHLQSGRHAATMRRVASKQKSILGKMRLVQRKVQLELERFADDLAPRTSWCPMCKLNYKQPKATHQASAAHLDMKRFLMPHCKVCQITFKSPMIHQSHICSIEHLKRKSAQPVKVEKDETSNNEEELENFMTIDSIGDVDEDGGDAADKKESEKPKEQHVGIDEIQKVEVYYCNLCKMYLHRVQDEEELNKEIARHCKQRTHLHKYIRFKEDKELTKKAERLAKLESLEKAKMKIESKESDKNKVAVAEENGEKAAKPQTDEAATVDEDNIDNLSHANDDGNMILIIKTDDEDEDEEDSVVNGGRYDRFKISEKNADEKKEVAEVVDEEEKVEITAEDSKI